MILVCVDCREQSIEVRIPRQPGAHRPHPGEEFGMRKPRCQTLLPAHGQAGYCAVGSAFRHVVITFHRRDDLFDQCPGKELDVSPADGWIAECAVAMADDVEV